MRILLSEGSGLTSRQVATRLGELGHEVEILSSTPICLAHFTRHVRAVHRVPAFGDAPVAWFEAARIIAHECLVDLLFPTQEQVAVLSAFEATLGVPTIVPRFAALRRVQDKVSAFETLREVGVAQPSSFVVRSQSDLSRVDHYPVFVKRPISTASSGVRRARSRAELDAAVAALSSDGRVVLVQAHAAGPLVMVQLVADSGRVIASHANMRVREGMSGGAATKESVAAPEAAAMGARLVAALGWHGALSFDVILTAGGPLVIDINPRLVEPANAWLAGVDLVDAMLALAHGDHPAPRPSSRAGVRSHQLLIALLGEACGRHPRRGVVRKLADAIAHRGAYADGVEELTPIAHDPLAAVPVAVAALATIAWPSSWRWFDTAAVGAYALTPRGWEQVLDAVARADVAGQAIRP